MIERLTQFIRAYLSPAPDSRPPSRLQVILWIGLLAVIFALSVRGYGTFQLGANVDDANYVVLARSLLYSNSYGLANVPGTPLPTHWPFGFPLVLAPFVALFPDNPQALTFVSLGATLLNISLLFWAFPLLTRNTSYWWGLAVAALYGIEELGATRMVMSEPVFISFTLLALILVEYHLRRRIWRWQYLLILGAVTTLTVFIRSIGVVVFVAVLARLIFAQPRTVALKNALGFLGGSIGFLALVIILTPVEPRDLFPSGYVSAVAESSQPTEERTERPSLIARALNNAVAYAEIHLRNTMIPFGGGESERAFSEQIGMPFLPQAFGLVVTGLMGVGCASLLMGKGPSPSALLYTALYFGALCVWLWADSGRFLSPIYPFLMVMLLRGVKVIVLGFGTLAVAPTRIRPLSDYVAALFAIILIVSWTVNSIPIDESYRHTRDFEVGTSWLNHSAPNDAVIMAQQPQAIYLYTQRRNTVDVPRVSTAAELEAVIDNSGVDYILVAPALIWRGDGTLAYDDYTQRVFLPLLDELEADEFLVRVYESDENLVSIFQVINTDTG